MSEIAWLRFVKKSTPPFFCPRIFIPGDGGKAVRHSNAIALTSAGYALADRQPFAL
jgi:hypothetical protein